MQHGWLVLIGVGAYWLYNRMNQPVIEMPLQQPAPIPQSTVQPLFQITTSRNCLNRQRPSQRESTPIPGVKTKKKDAF